MIHFSKRPMALAAGLMLLTISTSAIPLGYMSLTKNDLGAIRNVINEGITELVLPKFDDLDSRLQSVDRRLDRMDGQLAVIEQQILADYGRRIRTLEDALELRKR